MWNSVSVTRLGQLHHNSDEFQNDINMSGDRDNLLTNDDDDDLDREVESCLSGGLQTSGCDESVSSPSTASFYSADHDTDTASFYSYSTITTDTTEDTLTGRDDDDDDDDDVVPDQHDDEQGNTESEQSIQYTRPSALAGTSASPHLSRESLESVESDESEMSVAGVMNRRLGLLLGYHESLSPGQVSAGDTGGLSANITGYEIVCAGDKHKYTVYKIRVSSASSLLGVWYVHRRYSDFWMLRKKLIKVTY